jgi:hypothetical protein
VSDPTDKQEKTISFKYIFPNDLKELHVNGAFGGLGPDGLIRMALYSERQAIPNIERRNIKPEGILGEKLDEEKKYEMVRIVQSSLVFNAATARSFIEWLEARIKDIETYKKAISQIEGKGE